MFKNYVIEVEKITKKITGLHKFPLTSLWPTCMRERESMILFDDLFDIQV